MGIKYNGKVYNNLQGQVALNTKDIEKIKDAGIIGYEAGDGIDITSGVISVDTDIIQEKIEANPTEASTATLTKLEIDDVVYAVSGGSGPNQYIKTASVSGNTLTLTKQDDTTIGFTPSGEGGITDVKVDATSVVTEGVATIPKASTALGVVKGIAKTNETTSVAIDSDGQMWYTPGGGSSGGVSDVKVNGTSVVTGGVANVPVANGNNLGVVKGTVPNNSQLANAGIDSNGQVWYAETEGMLDATISDQWKSIKTLNAGGMVTKNIPRVSTANAGSGAQELHSVYVGDTQYALPSGGSGGSTTVGGGVGIEVTGTASSGYTVSAKANSENGGIVVASSGIGVNFNNVQAKLSAGNNVQIDGSTISATDTTYTAGSNVSISDNVISATDTNTITTLSCDDNSLTVTDEGTGDYAYNVAAKRKSGGGLEIDSDGLYVGNSASCCNLTFEVVTTEPGSPVANRIYFVYQS